MKKDAHLITVNAVRQINSSQFTAHDVWLLVRDHIAVGTLNVHLRMLQQSGEIAHVGYKQDGKAHRKLYQTADWAPPETGVGIESAPPDTETAAAESAA